MNLNLYNEDREKILHCIHFPVQLKDPASPPEVETYLYNRKGKTCNYTASDIKIFLTNSNKETSGGSNYQGQEIIDDNLIEVKSNGVIGTGIIDDSQSNYTPIGKEDYLSIGDIPVDCARRLYFRLHSNENTDTERAFFFIKVLYNYRRSVAYRIQKLFSESFFIYDYFLGNEFF